MASHGNILINPNCLVRKQKSIRILYSTPTPRHGRALSVWTADCTVPTYARCIVTNSINKTTRCTFLCIYSTIYNLQPAIFSKPVEVQKDGRINTYKKIVSGWFVYRSRSPNILTILLFLTSAEYPVCYRYGLECNLLSRSPNLTSLYTRCLYTQTFVSYVCCSEWSATGDALPPLLFKFALKMPLKVGSIKIERVPYLLEYGNLLSEDTGNLPYIWIRSKILKKNSR